jgi:6-phosphogluconolactonase
MSPNTAYIHSILSEAIAIKKAASFVVSGGSSPITIFQELSNADLDWSKITITLVDDRAVDKNHDDSNEKLLNEHLLINKASNANFVSLFTDSVNVKNIKGGYDLMLLGMGEDAHFASLFPSMIETSPEHFNINSKPEIIYTEPMGNPLHPRVSMNLSMILDSKKIILLASNSNKSEMISQAKNNTSLPLYYLFNQELVNIEILKTY